MIGTIPITPDQIAARDAAIMKSRLTPTPDESAKSTNDVLQDVAPESDSETFSDVVSSMNKQDGAIVVPNVITVPTDLLGGSNMSFWKTLETDATAFFGVLAKFAPAVMAIFLPNSKATPIVASIAPLVAPTMASASTILGAGATGAQKAQAATTILSNMVAAGQVVSKGGQAHTLAELQQAMPIINQIFTGVISAAQAASTAAETPATTVTTVSVPTVGNAVIADTTGIEAQTAAN